jgi:hypothetical protein
MDLHNACPFVLLTWYGQYSAILLPKRPVMKSEWRKKRIFTEQRDEAAWKVLVNGSLVG